MIGETGSNTWSVKRCGQRCILITFTGLVDARSGVASAERTLALLEEADEAVELRFDVLAVRAYRSQARVAWHRHILPKKPQIRSVTIASASPLAKMGGILFAAFLGIPCQFVRTRDELLRHIDRE